MKVMNKKFRIVQEIDGKIIFFLDMNNKYLDIQENELAKFSCIPTKEYIKRKDKSTQIICNLFGIQTMVLN